MMDEMSSAYQNGHKREIGRKNTVTKKIKEDQSTIKEATEITNEDNAEYTTGPDNTCARI